MSIVARENISNVETDLTKELKLPEFLPEENYKMSTKELVQSSNDAFNYSLAVVMKINSALYDIYMVQRMRKKRINNLTKVLREKMVSVISAEVYLQHLLRMTTKSIEVMTDSSSSNDSFVTDNSDESSIHTSLNSSQVSSSSNGDQGSSE